MGIRAFQDRDWPAWLRLSELLFPHKTRDALENVDSERAQERSGYVEMERLIVFRMALS